MVEFNKIRIVFVAVAIVGRLVKLMKGCGALYLVSYLSKAFHALCGCALQRVTWFLNRKRHCRLTFAGTYYGKMTHYGLYRLAWADMRRTR